MNRTLASTLAACVFAVAAPVFAANDLTGQNVQVDWLFGGPPVSIAQRTVTVGAGPEITCGGGSIGPDLCSYFVDGATIDIGANTIKLTIDSGTAYWGTSTFNGYTFSNLSSGGPWSGYALSTDFAGVDTSLVAFTPDSLSIDMQGIQPVAGQSFTFTLLNAVPEPASPVLFLAGLGVLACIARRRRA